MNGKPQTQPIFTNSDNPPELSVHFTLPAEIFDETKLAFSRFKKVIHEWRKRDFAAIFRAGQNPPTLNFRWLKQDNYYYSLRIKVFGDLKGPTTAQGMNQLFKGDK